MFEWMVQTAPAGHRSPQPTQNFLPASQTFTVSQTLTDVIAEKYLLAKSLSFFRRLVIHGDLDDDVRIRQAIYIVRKEFQPGRGRIWDLGFVEAKQVIGTFFSAGRKFVVYILIQR
jgi:hypothetical protein